MSQLPFSMNDFLQAAQAIAATGQQFPLTKPLHVTRPQPDGTTLSINNLTAEPDFHTGIITMSHGIHTISWDLYQDSEAMFALYYEQLLGQPERRVVTSLIRIIDVTRGTKRGSRIGDAALVNHASARLGKPRNLFQRFVPLARFVVKHRDRVFAPVSLRVADWSD